MTGELHIFDKKLGSTKSFLGKLVWRLLHKKASLDYETWMKGRCLGCDARGDGCYKMPCMEFYCPCKFDEHLKLR